MIFEEILQNERGCDWLEMTVSCSREANRLEDRGRGASEGGFAIRGESRRESERVGAAF